MKFIGRKEELTKLKTIIDSKEFAFSLIYGRRRVGKSELIKQALLKTSTKSIYYECKQVAEKSNIDGLNTILSDTFGLPKLGFTSIEEILEYIFKLSKSEKIILVLDEYPYLRESIKGMDSILQALIDKYRDSSKLKLIILGSFVGVMRSLIEHSSPLYGRTDLVINLKQMDYYESAMFYPNYSPVDKARIYSVFGGIPYYNRLIDETKSVKENIIELIASSGSRLENEVSMYLNAELSKITNANEVFDVLARGYSKYSDILSKSHVTSGPTLVDVLDKLISMEIIEKTTPINISENKKKTSYYIADNLSMFYYRYIYKYSSSLSIMNAEDFYKKYIEKDFEEQYVPHVFESICKQYLINKNKSGEITPVIEKIGKYYYDDPKKHLNGEFDIVTKDENGYIFYEVKFSKNSISEKTIEDEINQVKLTNLDCYKYVFFSRSGFEIKEKENIKLININEIY